MGLKAGEGCRKALWRRARWEGQGLLTTERLLAQSSCLLFEVSPGPGVEKGRERPLGEKVVGARCGHSVAELQARRAPRWMVELQGLLRVSLPVLQLHSQAATVPRGCDAPPGPARTHLPWRGPIHEEDPRRPVAPSSPAVPLACRKHLPWGSPKPSL